MTSKTGQYTIFVNSTDSFEDCWEPFFRLFSIFWPDCKQTIVLNTETKDFSYPGLDIHCSKVYGKNQLQKLTWSECLFKCLSMIETDSVIYLQDDYFLKAPVDVDLVTEFAEIMAHEGYSHIGLTPFASSGPWKTTKHSLLREVDQKASYRISMQAALWKNDRLRFYLRKHENPWQFEVWGTKRAHRIKDSFYSVNREIFTESGRQVIPYTPTGIVKGKWNKDAVYELFQKHGIDVDFSKRGFYVPNASSTKGSLLPRIAARVRSYF